MVLQIGDDIADLLFIKRASPSRHEAGLAHCAPAFRYDFDQELISKLIHDHPIGMVRRFYWKQLGSHANPIALFTVAGGAIGYAEFSTRFLVLRCRRTEAGHEEREKPERQDDPPGHNQFTFYLKSFPISD